MKLRRGFSMVEVMVAIALLGLGITAAIGALGQLTHIEGKNRETELTLRLCREKLEELRATGDLDFAPLSGEFEETNRAGYAWSCDVEPSDVENLEIVRVRVYKSRNDESTGLQLTTLRFVPPIETGGQAQ